MLNHLVLTNYPQNSTIRWMRKLFLTLGICFLFFASIVPVYAQEKVLDCNSPVNRMQTTCIASNIDISTVLATVVQFIFVISVVLALGFLIYGGVKWITSGGDKGGVENARNMIVAAIIGLIIVFLAYVIMNLVLTFLTGQGLSSIEIPSLSGSKRSTTTGTSGSASTGTAPTAVPTGIVIQEQPRAESKDGEFEEQLVAQKAKVKVGNETKETNVYNGHYQGQVIVVRGGDILRLRLINRTSKNTNLHFHGGHVSPKGNSDNLFLAVKPGETFDFEYRLPINHSPGLYWYHPVIYGSSEKQVSDGMVGAIIVKGNIDELPGIKGLSERLFILTTQKNKDNKLDSPVRLVNGLQNPRVLIKPGEVQRWRIVNASANDFYNFAIQGQSFSIISRDGNTLNKPFETKNELLVPGDRIEILVKGPKLGKYDVKSLAFDQGVIKYKENKFMILESTGAPILNAKIPTALFPFDDLRRVSIANEKKLLFSKSGSGKTLKFLLNGKEFNPKRIDQSLTLNTVDEWTLTNSTNEWYTFHIQTNPFQVVEVNGEPVEQYSYQDTIGVPSKGSVKLRIRYRDFDGKILFFSEILTQADHGMMQVGRIIDPASPNASLNN